MYKRQDLSSSSIEVNDSEVNYKKAGTYKAVVVAKDSSNNETKKEIEIVVKEEKKDVSTNKSNSNSSTKKNNTSPSSSSSNKTNSNTSSSSNQQKKGELKPGQWNTTVDEDSYTEIMGGNGSAWGGSGVLPEGY